MSRSAGKFVSSVLTLLLLFNTEAAGMAFANNSTVSTEQDVIVVYNNVEGKETVVDESVEVLHEFESIPAVSATVSNNDLQELANDPNIAYIERNISLRIAEENFRTSSIASEEQFWNFQAIQPRTMWSKGYTGTGVKVAVIDSGIYPHSELRIAGGISTVDYTTSYIDDNGHGTHVAGIIAALSNGTGTTGVAPGVDLYAVKTMDSNGEGNLLDLLEGMDWAIQNDMDIINISLGTDSESQALEDVMNQAYTRGILLVASAGNSQENIPLSVNTVNYPAKYDSVIAVGAVDAYLNRGIFSSVGEEVEFMAPGVEITSTFVSNGTAAYAIAEGTSQAAPHVTGMLALLKQANPLMNNVQLREELKKYTTDLGAFGRDPEYGFGSLSFIQDVAAPANVSNLQVSGKGERTISVTWNNPADADFNVNYVYLDGVKVDETAGQAFDFNGLDSNTTYLITITSLDRKGNESIGSSLTAVTGPDTTAPAEVSNLQVAHATENSILLAWDNPADADFRHVDVYMNEAFAQTVTGDVYEAKELNPSTTYRFLIQTVDFHGNKSQGRWIDGTTSQNSQAAIDNTPPAEVSHLTITDITSSSVKVKWSNPLDTDFVKTAVYLNGQKIDETTGTEYEFRALAKDRDYLLGVKTVDSAGNTSSGITLPVRTRQQNVIAPPVDSGGSTPVPPSNPVPGPSNPAVPGDQVVTVPVNPTPPPTGDSAMIGGGGGGAAVPPVAVNQPAEASEAEQATNAAVEKARSTRKVMDYVAAKFSAESMTDANSRKEFTSIIAELKQELGILELPVRKAQLAGPLNVSLQALLNNSDFKYIDPTSLKPGKNVFLVNNDGELVEDVRIEVRLNRIVVRPSNGKFAANETYRLIIDSNVKLKAAPSAQATELQHPLILEFKTGPAVNPVISGVKIPFKDVKKGVWYESTLKWGITQSLVKGYGDGSFKPNQSVSESEMLAMLLRAFEADQPAVSGKHWAEPYYQRAKELRYPVSGNTSLRSKPILRKQVAELIAAAEGLNLSGDDAIRYLLTFELAKGKNPNTSGVKSFDGNSKLTRAEAIQFIMNLRANGIGTLLERPVEPTNPQDIPQL